MYMWSPKDKGITGVQCLEGKFTLDPGLGLCVELKMIYVNATTQQRLGSCTIPIDTLTDEAKSTLQDFIRMAEGDFGRVVSGDREVEDQYGAEPSEPRLRMPDVKPLGG